MSMAQISVFLLRLWRIFKSPILLAAAVAIADRYVFARGAHADHH